MNAGGRPLLGVALVVAMGALFAAMDTTIRFLGGALPVLLLLTARYAFQAAVMTAWIALARGASFRPAHPRFQLLRGVLLLVTSAFSFFGLQAMPVAEFTAIILLTPVLVTLFSATVLNEPVSPLRWALVAGAFAGALIVIRPGSGLFGWAVLYPVGGTIAYAGFQVLTRRLAGVENATTTHWWTGATGTAILLPLLLAFEPRAGAALAAATPGQLALLLFIGACGTFGHLLLILAFRFAPPATLMPFVYLQLGSAAVAGYVAFGVLPDGWGWVGMAVIAACGAASAWLNVVAARNAAPPKSAAADSVIE